MWLRTRPLLLVIVLCTYLCTVSAKISDKRLCADPKCEVQISEGVTSLKYTSRYSDVLSFGQNANVKIYSKSAGSDESLWGVEIKNKRGYAPAKMIRESRILYKGDNWYEVPTAEEVGAVPPPVTAPAVPEMPVAQTNEPSTVPVVDSMASDPAEIVSGEAEEEKEKVEEVLVEEPKVEEQIAEAFQQLPTKTDQLILNEEEEVVEDVPVVLEKIPSASSLNLPSPIEELKADEAQPPTLASSNADIPSPEVPEVKIEKPEEQKVEEPLNPVVDESEDDEAGVDYEEDDDEEEEDDEDEEEDDEEVAVPPAVKVEEESNQEGKEAPQEISQPPVIENIVPPTPIEEQQPVNDLPPIVQVLEEVSSSSANEEQGEKTESPPDVPINAEISDSVPPLPPAPVEIIPPPLAEVPPQTTEEAGQVVVVPDDLPTPPSSLLGNFINMNSDAVPMVTPSPPPAMHFEETEKQTIEELENSTDSFNGNGTETAEMTKEEQPQQDAKVVTEAPMDPAGLPVAGQYLNDNYGEKYFEAVPPPLEGEPILMENRIPPVVQEQLDINNYYEQLQSNPGKYPKIPQHDYIPQPPAVPAYPPAPPQVDQHYHHEHGSIPSLDSPSVETHHEEMPISGHGTVEEQQVPTETPPPSIPQEVNYHQDAPAPTPDSPQTTEEMTEEDPKEEVESGPGFMEKIIGHAKSLLGSIDLTSLFKSKESSTPPDSIVYGEHVEEAAGEEFCEKLSPNSNCPDGKKDKVTHPPNGGIRHPMISHRESAMRGGEVEKKIEPELLSSIDYDAYLVKFLDSLVSMTDVILCMTVVAATLLVFIFMHLCFSRSQKENHFVGKLNALERQLMHSMKTNQLMDSELAETKHQLCSIQDNSFGANDMVKAVRHELDQAELQKHELQEQVIGLEKELETAAEAGLELNRMVSELLSNQQGSDTIISSVEGLQAQLNEQQETIHAINTLLAEKSRENSELLVELSELRTRCEEGETGRSDRVIELEEQVEAVSAERDAMERAVQEKADELERVKKTLLLDMERRLEEATAKNLKAEARIEVLEESLKALKGGEGGAVDKAEMAKLLSVARVKTNLLAAVKERDHMAEKLEGESRAKAMLEEQMRTINEDVQRLRTEYNQMEKEKLEANTKLGILSNYFKEKETQLQKELSVKEAQCMQQQGETTSTVEKIRSMQEEIQSLKSHNEGLKNEVEVQEATHKTQILSLENRAHESWLATRQTERRLEESRSEAAALRRKLTAMSNAGAVDGVGADNGMVNGTASSPLHMDGNGGPGSPIMPPLPGFMPPPPFMPAPPMPHGFMPPPPFEMRPPPLGRLMSPPPPGVNPGTRYSPHLMDRNGRYTPDNHRYDHFSPYETETDISPPPSPPQFRSRHSSGGSGTNYNNSGNQGRPTEGRNPKKFGNKGSHRNNYSDRSDEFV